MTYTFQVRTSYAGPTDTKGSRITARAVGRQLTVQYDYAALDPHIAAVHDLLRSLGYADVLPITLVQQTPRGFLYNVEVDSPEAKRYTYGN